MLTKAFAGFVVAFWVVMMAALVRVEFFPQPLSLDRYPTQRVLKKIFANPEPAQLNVFYRGAPVGLCGIEIRPKFSGEATDAAATGRQPDAYEVISKLHMKLSVFGMPSRLSLRGQSTFTPQLDLASFRMKTVINEGSILIAGDDVSKKVKVVFDLGEIHDERVFDFGQLQRAGFASAFGLPGLANLSFAGDSGSLDTAASRSDGAGAQPRPTTVTYFDRLDVAGSELRVFLIYSKINDQLWTKIWVSESDGEVLKVSTSLGLEMTSNVLR
jgi:hypothetical protein